MKKKADHDEQDDKKRRLWVPQAVVDWLPVVAAVVQWLVENL